MSGADLEPGLYVIEMDGFELPRKQGLPQHLRHSGVLDVGNTLGLPDLLGISETLEDSTRPVLVHLTNPQITIEAFETGIDFVVKERIDDLKGSLRRILECLQSPDYNPIVNNCEHFANYVARGERESPQLFAYTATASILGGGFLLFKLFKGATRLLS